MDVVSDPVVGTGGAWRIAAASAPGRPPVRQPGPSIRGILPGAAERVTVAAPATAPWRGVALINLFVDKTVVRIGTGFLCEADVLLTARHNLLPATYDSAGVWLGYDRSTNPGVQPALIRAWATHSSLDLAVLILSTSAQGVFELGGPLAQIATTVALGGYGMPYPDNGGRLSQSEGPVAGVSQAKLSYVISTREGDSGAPVLAADGQRLRAVGVHTSSANAGEAGNSGQPLTPAVIQDIRTMTAWARAQIGE